MIIFLLLVNQLFQGLAEKSFNSVPVIGFNRSAGGSFAWSKFLRRLKLYVVFKPAVERHNTPPSPPPFSPAIHGYFIKWRRILYSLPLLMLSVPAYLRRNFDIEMRRCKAFHTYFVQSLFCLLGNGSYFLVWNGWAFTVTWTKAIHENEMNSVRDPDPSIIKQKG